MTKFEKRANIITFCILIVFLIIMFICIMCFDPADKREYYSHKTVIINNIEYRTEDTEFISNFHGQLVIKLPNGDEIHTNHYKFKN